MPAEALTQRVGQADATRDRARFALGVNSSFAGRSWRIRDGDEDVARALERAGYSAARARVLASPGVTRDSVDARSSNRV